MKPEPAVGQRWSWEYKFGDGKHSLCIFEITSVTDERVCFKYVQIVFTNYTEYVGQKSCIGKQHLGSDSLGIFIYLAGQDSPEK